MSEIKYLGLIVNKHGIKWIKHTYKKYYDEGSTKSQGARRDIWVW